MVDSQVLQDRTQPHHVLARLVGAAKLGFAHDLHQRHAGAVEVHERALRLVDGALVEQLAGVFLEVDAGDAAAARLAPHIEIEMAAPAERQIVLRDLVALRQVGIEIVLAIELGKLRDFAVQRQRGADGRLDRPPVDHRQRARQPEADRAGVRVRWSRQVVGGTAAEHLALRQHLGMDLQPDDDLVFGGDRAHAAAPISGD